MHTQPRTSPLVALRRKYGYLYDVAAMAVYTVVVYSSGLLVYPLGRDYNALADSANALPFLVRDLFAWEMNAFGTAPVGYHVVNMILLYGCMLLVSSLVHKAVKGPYWLGTLAAVLFMANPVHAESVLNLSGIAELVPCLFALAAILSYASLAEKARHWRWIVALALLAVAAFPYRENVFLILVMILYECLVVESGRRRIARLVPFVAVGLGAFYHHGPALLGRGFPDLARTVAPIYFLVYPIGFLPETARNFHEYPWLGWLAGAAVAAILILIFCRARRSAIIFGVLSAVVVNLLQDQRFLDPVHLVGGGQLLLANALFNVGLVALFHRIMDHPNWRTTVAIGTTLLCVVLFALQIRSNLAWHRAGNVVKHFQRQAENLISVGDGRFLAIIPDYTYYRGAPLCLSSAIAHDTLFSKAVPAVSGLSLHYDIPERMQVSVDDWSPDGGTITVTGKAPVDVACWPYTLAREKGALETDTVRVELIRADDDGFTVSIIPKAGPLPALLLPGGSDRT